MKQMLLLVIAGVVAVVAGMSAGQLFRTNPIPRPAVAFEPDLYIGDEFPDVELADGNGTLVSSRDLATGNGAVVLFIDPDCAPCGEVTARWQQRIDAGRIDADQVVGIGMRGPEEMAAYTKEKGLRFAVYADTQGAFQREYGVHFFPLEVVVGSSGTIGEVHPGTLAPLDMTAVDGMLGQ